ncbi:MAG: mannosyltransferase [Sphingobacteriales bacterium]|nr:mannosyltransferase [Sphingobacteriales bacterium]
MRQLFKNRQAGSNSLPICGNIYKYRHPMHYTASLLQKILFLSVATLLLLYLGYGVERWQWVRLLAAYSTLFGAVLWAYRKWGITETRFLWAAGLLFRCLLLRSLPALSQDYARFLWDGNLLLCGINPYLHTPAQLLQQNLALFPAAHELYAKMGALSANNFSNYPPLHQYVFALCVYIGKQQTLPSLLAMKIILLLSDVGIYYFGKKLLQQLRLPPHTIFLYFLNPFILLEISANAHFESLMLCAWLAALWALSLGAWRKAAALLGAAISVKLLPLLCLPFLAPYFGRWRKFGIFCALIFLVNVALALPFLHPAALQHYWHTLALWFVKFEFNASFYYIIRTLGYWYKGYNIIGTVGQILPVLTAAAILLSAARGGTRTLPLLISAQLWPVSLYFFQSSTIHPWYVANVLLWSLFTRYRFALLWSWAVFLSYSAYRQYGVAENMPLIALEYGLIYAFLYTEWRHPVYLQRFYTLFHPKTTP